MSVEKVDMFTIVCDNCKTDIGSIQEYSCWADEYAAKDNAMESEWINVGSKHYCPDCVWYDDDVMNLKIILNE